MGGSVRDICFGFFFSKQIPRATTAGWLSNFYSASAFVCSVAPGNQVGMQGGREIRGNLSWKVRITDPFPVQGSSHITACLCLLPSLHLVWRAAGHEKQLRLPFSGGEHRSATLHPSPLRNSPVPCSPPLGITGEQGPGSLGWECQAPG